MKSASDTPYHFEPCNTAMGWVRVAVDGSVPPSALCTRAMQKASGQEMLCCIKKRESRRDRTHDTPVDAFVHCASPMPANEAHIPLIFVVVKVRHDEHHELVGQLPHCPAWYSG
jgi:hypothetical protein